MEGSVTYEVFLALGKDGDFKMVEKTTKNSYIGPNAHFRLKVRPNNICGVGNESPVFDFARVPSKVPNVFTVVEGCDIVLTWEKPAYDGGSLIEEYKVEIQGNDGKMKRYLGKGPRCGGTKGNRKCVIPFTELFEPPFSLESGLRIIIRVIAVNDVGDSKPSKLDGAGPTQLRRPPVLQAP